RYRNAPTGRSCQRADAMSRSAYASSGVIGRGPLEHVPHEASVAGRQRKICRHDPIDPRDRLVLEGLWLSGHRSGEEDDGEMGAVVVVAVELGADVDHFDPEFLVQFAMEGSLIVLVRLH